MFQLTDDEEAALARLAKCLQHWRVNKEPVADFVARVGVSAPTYTKLEKADPTVQIGLLVRALRLAGHLDDLDLLLTEKGVHALFAEKKPSRQRAPRRPQRTKF